MRTYLHINLSDRTVKKEQMEGEQLARAGRYHIVKTMLDRGLADCDPLGPDNPLIFSAGPFAGSNFSNANRISVGCKSPLTGGIKESNAGGTFGFALGQLELSGLTLYGQSDEWVVMYISKEGEIDLDRRLRRRVAAAFAQLRPLQSGAGLPAVQWRPRRSSGAGLAQATPPMWWCSPLR